MAPRSWRRGSGAEKRLDGDLARLHIDGGKRAIADDTFHTKKTTSRRRYRGGSSETPKGRPVKVGDEGIHRCRGEEKLKKLVRVSQRFPCAPPEKRRSYNGEFVVKVGRLPREIHHACVQGRRAVESRNRLAYGADVQIHERYYLWEKDPAWKE